MESAYDIVAPQMRSLKKLEHDLQRMDLRWEVIETTARIVCPRHASGFLGTLASTRSAFGALATEMVEHIADAHLTNRRHDLASKAQVMIDILVRNLFERTADVGFIATDAPLRQFVQAPDADQAARMHARLEAYRAKYTVYDDIVVLDVNARPLVRLQARDDAPTGMPDWWQDMLARDTWIERHGACPLFPGAGDVLVYAHRVHAPDGHVRGAVVLCFGLASELDMVFQGLADARQRIALVLVDAQGRVLASNRPGEFDVGERLAASALQPEQSLVTHHGHDYLMQARTTRGYQGYRGLPWTAVALVRLDVAFRDGAAGAVPAGEEAEVDTDDERLREIVTQARAIEEGLARVTWNGKLTDARGDAGSSLHAVFDQIGRTGSQTVALFHGAIGELRRLLMEKRRAEMAAHAALAVDIMDRNLYERANDCRWWALSDELVNVLAEREDNSADEARRAKAAARAGEILGHLNSLYTVYRRVALFDRHGQVVAVSRDADMLPPDLRMDEELCRRVLALPGPQAYAVSPMQPSALADGAPTYLYCATLRTAQGAAIGGMALAFDSAQEFRAMLRDAAPDAQTALGFYVDARNRIVAGSGDELAVGEDLPFAVQAADAHAAQGARSALIQWRGQEYLMGAAPSTGYREFKRSDGYVEAITAVLLSPVRRSAPMARMTLPSHAGAAAVGARRYGVVACGHLVLALDSEQVVEAIAVDRVVALPGAPQYAGMVEHTTPDGTTVLAAVDTLRLSGQPPMARTQGGVAVVVRSRGRALALLVNGLLGVIETDRCQAPPDTVRRHAQWITGVISDESADLPMVYVVDPDHFDATLAPLQEQVLRVAA